MDALLCGRLFFTYQLGYIMHNLTKNQRLIKSALIDKLKRGGLKIDDQNTLCELIEQIEIGTGILTIPE